MPSASAIDKVSAKIFGNAQVHEAFSYVATLKQFEAMPSVMGQESDQHHHSDR